jgi:transcriptional regulator with XRE-family HTH domain
MKRNRQPSLEILGRLAGNLRRLRKARGYTRERLAKVCGLTKNYIGNIEQETVNISLGNLEALAKGLNCREADLLVEGNEPHGPRTPMGYGFTARRQHSTANIERHTTLIRTHDEYINTFGGRFIFH